MGWIYRRDDLLAFGMLCCPPGPSLKTQFMPLAQRSNGTRRAALESIPPDDVLFGKSPAMFEVRQRAAKVSNTNVPMFLCGEVGTGKEALARWIHKHSPNCNGQFVKVNCAAIPGPLLESELFGYEKGAFTGAYVSKPGRVEAAHKGTLFLDGIADLDPCLQSKLLQFLQDGRFSRIGGTEERQVEARLICATNKDLKDEIKCGRFRSDLFYRISVVHIRLPRLRDRREDIPELVSYFLDHFQNTFAKPAEPLDRSVVTCLQKEDWPGNIRELSNDIARRVLLGPDIGIPPHRVSGHQPIVHTNSKPNVNVPLREIAKEAIRDRERSLILETLRANQWNRRRTAEVLRISYRTLIYKIRAAGLTDKR